MGNADLGTEPAFIMVRSLLDSSNMRQRDVVHPHLRRRRGCSVVLVVSAVLAAAASTSHLLTFVATAPRRPHPGLVESSLRGAAADLQRCGRLANGAAATGTAQTSWLPGWASSSTTDQLSPRDWVRMYRVLGLPEDASRHRVLKATSRLRKKYADDEEALERAERANLWIMTRFVTMQEAASRKRQQANRLRELGDSPRMQKYLPPSIVRMLEAPSTTHFRTASGLLGAFALLGLCVPTQSSNFVGLASAATMGLIYQRSRPEPVKDEFGNVGAIQKPNPKEMLATIGVTASGVFFSLTLAWCLANLIDAPFDVLFCLTTCAVLWLVSLSFRVYQCFDA